MFSKFIGKVKQSLVLVLLIIHNPIVSASQDTTEFTACALGLDLYVIPLMKRIKKPDQIAPVQTQSTIAFASAAYAVVEEVLKSQSEDIISDIRITASNYRNEATSQWGEFENSRERLDKIAKLCQKVSEGQSEIIASLQSMGYFNMQEKSEAVITLRELVGTALYTLKPN